MRGKELVVDEVPDPKPGPGQVLARTIACGICGSDLHALRFGDQMVALSEEGAADIPETMRPKVMDLARDVVMGHEFSAEVVDLGENTGNCKVGDVIVSMPILMDVSGIHPIGYSNDFPGGYSELLVLNDMMALKVPNGLDPRHAALTEPMAVGVHAVNKSQIKQGDAAVVLGCGPIGLATVAALRLKGIEPIVAADFSPKRRDLARRMGAHEVVDPREEPAMQAWRRLGAKQPVHIYEAVGVPGMIDSAMRDAPRDASILVVGVCMEQDHIRPMLGIARELTVRFALGYDPMEFASTLTAIADGQIDVAPLVTGEVGIAGVPQAFQDLADPEAHAKILVEPALD
jgi:threonine dehydrogenase-like Zn-dependent dehydrogenase